jgi:hypothetical protein
MRIALVHLSDFHLVNGNNVVVRRARAIGSAARAGVADAKHCFLLVSGDIAFSGKTTEYDIADRFLKTVLEVIRKDGVDVTVALAARGRSL